MGCDEVLERAFSRRTRGTLVPDYASSNFKEDSPKTLIFLPSSFTCRPRLSLTNPLNSSSPNSSEMAFQVAADTCSKLSPTRSLGGYLAEAHQKRFPRTAMSILNDGRVGALCPSRPNLRVFNEDRRCRLWDGEFRVGGEGEGDGEMEYDEALEMALYERSDGVHDFTWVRGMRRRLRISIHCFRKLLTAF